MAFDFENNISVTDDYLNLLVPCTAIAEMFTSQYHQTGVEGIEVVYDEKSNMLHIRYNMLGIQNINYSFPCTLLFTVLYKEYGSLIAEFLDKMAIWYDKSTNKIQLLFDNHYITINKYSENTVYEYYEVTPDGIRILNMEWFAYLIRFAHMEQINCEPYVYRHFCSYFTLTTCKNKNSTGFVFLTPHQLHEFAVYFMKDNHNYKMFGDEGLITSPLIYKQLRPIKNLLYISLQHHNIKLKGIKNFSDFSHLSMFDICAMILKAVKTHQNIV